MNELSPQASELAISGYFFVGVAVVVVTLIGLWMVFAKADRPGWAALVPIYNGIVLLQIAHKPVWWIVLLLIPGVNLVVAIVACSALARCFGLSASFGWGLVLLPFIYLPVLGFGRAFYFGPPARDSVPWNARKA